MERFIALLTSENPKERELAVELCEELISEPDEEFCSRIASLIGTVSFDATITILGLLTTYRDWLDNESIPQLMDLFESRDNSLRLAAFRFAKQTMNLPSATHLLDALSDELDEIQQIASDGLHEMVLCESTAFEVATYLRHDDPQIREAASELLMGCGQKDLLEKMGGGIKE